MIDREGLVNQIPVLTPEYSILSQWILVLFLILTYSLLIHFCYGPNTCSHCTGDLTFSGFSISISPPLDLKNGDFCNEAKLRSSVLVFFLTILLLLRSQYVFTLHRSMAQNLSDMWRSTIENGAARLRFVTAITVLMGKQKPYLVWFSCGRKSYLLYT